MTPDRPPMMNIAMKPRAKYIGVRIWSDPPATVPIQLKIFTPVGIAISIVESENTVSAIGPIPVANMWWLHTPKPRNAMKMPEKTIAA
jgi:hypothetical protein